jgi:hypothetical protein
MRNTRHARCYSSFAPGVFLSMKFLNAEAMDYGDSALIGRWQRRFSALSP